MAICEKNRFGHFLDNFCKQLRVFLFQHLVTRTITQKILILIKQDRFKIKFKMVYATYRYLTSVPSVFIQSNDFLWAIPGLFFVYFWSFQTNNTIFATNQCPSSIRRRDSNPWPYKHESLPIPTRPGLQPIRSNVMHQEVTALASSRRVSLKKNINFHLNRFDLSDTKSLEAVSANFFIL